MVFKMLKIGILVPVCSRNQNYDDWGNIPLLKRLIPSFQKTKELGYIYKFYIGIDNNDDFYLSNIEKFKDIETLSTCTYVLSDCNHKPAHAWNKLLKVAYEDGCDYFFQVGDDIVIETPGWTSEFLSYLSDLDNIGVTGPCEYINYKGRMSSKNPKTVIENAFFSRKHYEIFGTLFDDRIKNWFCDDWISDVYGSVGRMKMFLNIMCNNGVRGVRYHEDKGFSNYKQILEDGCEKLKPYVKEYPLKIHAKGRLGNKLFQNMVFHFIAEKYNFKVDYLQNSSFKELGINLFQGTRGFKKSMNQFFLTDDNFFSYIVSPTMLDNSYFSFTEWVYAQTKEFATHIRTYLCTEEQRKNIIDCNPYKDRYENNNDVCLHVRLGDVPNFNPGYDYYDKVLEQIKFENGYICSDSINHPICKRLIQKYNLVVIQESEVKTIQFASTCKNIVLSKGTFSWMIGLLGFYSTVYFPKLTTVWHGDIYFNDWNQVYV